MIHKQDTKELMEESLRELARVSGVAGAISSMRTVSPVISVSRDSVNTQISVNFQKCLFYDTHTPASRPAQACQYRKFSITGILRENHIITSPRYYRKIEIISILR